MDSIYDKVKDTIQSNDKIFIPSHLNIHNHSKTDSLLNVKYSQLELISEWIEFEDDQ